MPDLPSAEHITAIGTVITALGPIVTAILAALAARAGARQGAEVPPADAPAPAPPPAAMECGAAPVAEAVTALGERVGALEEAADTGPLRTAIEALAQAAQRIEVALAEIKGRLGR